MSKKTKKSLSLGLIFFVFLSLILLIFSSFQHLRLGNNYYKLLTLEGQFENLNAQHTKLREQVMHALWHNHDDQREIKLRIHKLRVIENSIALTGLPSLKNDWEATKALSSERVSLVEKIIDLKNPKPANKSLLSLKNNPLVEEFASQIEKDPVENALNRILSKLHAQQNIFYIEENTSKLWLIWITIFTLAVAGTALLVLYFINKNLKEKDLLLERQKINLDIAALVSETDTRGIITYVNQEFCEVSKYSEKELIGKPHSVINSQYHDKKFWTDFWKTIKAGMIWRGEVCNKAKDGSLYWVQTTIVPMFDKNKKITGYSSIRVNITDKKEAELKLQHSQKLALVGELSASIGHEINNPLMIINGNIKKIIKAYEDGTPFLQVKESFDITLDAIKRIILITAGLRNFVRADKHTIEPVDLHKEITSTLRLIHSTLKDSSINLTTRLDACNFIIKGNIGRTQQVLMNIFSNAKDAMESTAQKNLTVSTENKNDSILIHITDTGTGIAENIKDKIFKSYFTTKEAGKGTGLGLEITASIVSEFNGKIHFESEIGKGTTFTISFPVLTSAEAAAHESLKDNVKTKLTGHALVVDDEKGIRRILQEELQDLGLSVDQADSGISAIQQIKEKKYDYIFTDMQMPQMNGFEFIKEALKLTNNTTEYYVISGGITAALDSDQKNWLNSVVCGYINKPFGGEDILKVINKGNCHD